MTIRPIIFSTPMVRALLDGRKTQTRRLASSPLRLCQPGDLLYVRETFTADGVPSVTYFADQSEESLRLFEGAGVKWSPSLHMPRTASRLALHVSEMRSQRLHDITDEDAIAEGVQRSKGGMWCGGPHRAHQFPRQWNTPRDAYADLWSTLHGAGSWERNPMVVAISFKVHKVNVDRFEMVAA
jgi:hypothetical protein